MILEAPVNTAISLTRSRSVNQQTDLALPGCRRPNVYFLVGHESLTLPLSRSDKIGLVLSDEYILN